MPQPLTIDPQVAYQVENVNLLTGLSPTAIESHWYGEEGPKVLTSSDWSSFYNNPAGIMHGTPAVDKLATGTKFNGYSADGQPLMLDVFPTMQAGATAYAEDILTDSNFTGIRNSAVTSNPGVQLQAIANSPWGTPAQNLIGGYDAVTGATYTSLDQIKGTQGTLPNLPGIAQTSTEGGAGNVAQAIGSTNGGAFGNLANALGGSTGTFDWKMVITILGGSILIIMLLYRLVTK